MQRPFQRHNRHTLSGPHGFQNRLPHVELEIVRGRARSKRRLVSVPAFLIGAALDCDLVLGDSQFPEVLAYLLVRPEGVSIRHLGFAPEVCINGQPITRSTLADGDRIRTGPLEFQVHIRFAPFVGVPDQWPLEIEPASDRVEDEVGLTEVETLIAEIRRQLYPVAARLRLYLDPDHTLSQPPFGDASNSPSKFR